MRLDKYLAAALGIPEGTAKSRLYALVHDLREKLKEYEKLVHVLLN